MSQSLADLLPVADTPLGLRLWLKSSAYTRRLLLGDGGDPWESASQYLAYFSQAHGLLKPDVAVLEVGELFDSWLRRHPELQPELGAKRKFSFPLRKWLEQEGPREILAEVVTALLSHLRGQAPLVLAMPSPCGWLRHANRAAGREDVAPEAGDIEDAAMYVADLMRAVSMFEIGGLLLEEQAADSGDGPVDLELYRPLINVAKHYRWPMAVRLAGNEVAPGAALADIDVVIGSGSMAGLGQARGIDVSVALWGGGEVPAPAAGQFYFVEVPQSQRPEHVLECLSRLRG